MAIDSAANKIYWSNEFDGTISFANLDGTGDGGQLDTIGAPSNHAYFLALLQPPSGTGAPAVTGGSTAGSTLSCSHGAWTADQPGASLARAPHSYAYSWTRDGATIPAATASTTIASSAGDYACQVTAQNHAGTSTQSSTAHAVVAAPPAPSAPAASAPAVTAPAHRASARRRLKLAVSRRRTRAARRVCLAFKTTSAGHRVPRATVHLAHRRARTSRTGKARICLRLRPGRYHARATKRGFKPARATVRIRPRRHRC